MQLYYFLAVLISLSFGSLPPSEQSPGHALLFTGLVILAWWMLCLLSVRLVIGLIADREIEWEVGCDWFDRHTACLRWFSIGLITLCLGGFGLGRNLASAGWLAQSSAAQSMLLLSPAVALMSGLWFAEYCFTARLGAVRWSVMEALRWVASSLRGHLGWLCVPILAIMLALDVATLASLADWLPGWSQWVVLAMLFAVGLPVFVRRVFPTRPMNPEVKGWIESIVAQSQLGKIRIVLWDTGQRKHNAMIAGVLGRFRILLLSDRIVEELPRQELAMVVLHEVAHAKRFHIPLRIAALIPAWMLGFLIERVLSQEPTFAGLADWAEMLGSGFSLLATVLLLRVISYRSEYDADHFACRLAPQVAIAVDDVPATQADAAFHLASALMRVTNESETARQPSWLHPGLADRIDNFLAI